MFGILISIFCVVIVIYIIVIKNEEENDRKKKLSKEGFKYSATYTTEMKHVCGLPLTQNSQCIIHLCDNHIVIESMGNVFKVQKDKIMDMNIKTSKEIQNSISGAVGGAILLGPIGAFIGGSSVEFHRFFIIIYRDKENEEQCISFDMKEDLKTYKQVYNYIENFKKNITDRNEIEL